MEESLNLIETAFSLEKVDVRAHSPLALAFIGDGVFDLIIRTVIVTKHHQSVRDLHKKTVAYVKAETQANLVDAIMEELTADEEAVYRRGRNAKSNTTAKNASIVAYRKATGLEALIGFLYLTGQMQRAVTLVKLAVEKSETSI
ncbi:MAG: ribonuclease III domain-containing protein [Lachnospiraceae bacterium]